MGPFLIEETEAEKFVGELLDAYKDGRAGRETILSLLAHTMMAAASGNEAECRAYMQVWADSAPPHG